MAPIILVRPGATEFDQQHRIQGVLDLPLCDEGQRQVEQLVADLADEQIQAIYTSPCQSARQTAEQLAAALNVRLKVLDKLRNVDLGLWQGRRIEEVRQTQPRVYRQWQEHPQCVCPPQGEPFTEAQLRVGTALAKLLKKQRDGAIALVVPEPLATLVRSELLGAELGDLWKAAVDHAPWERIVPRRLVASGNGS